MTNTTLLPCPFCGSSSELCVIGGDECGWYVECFNCFATGGDAGTRDKAIEVWNTRAERTCKLTAPVSDIGWCSECNAPINKLDLPNYCPNCGARGPEAISDAKARAAWIARADGCKVAGVYDYGDRDQYRVYALSCGHAFEWNDDKPPAYCPECGAKVVSE